MFSVSVMASLRRPAWRKRGNARRLLRCGTGLDDRRAAILSRIPDDERDQRRNRQQHQNKEALLDAER